MSHWKTFLKVIFVFIVFYFLGKKGFVSFEKTQQAFDSPQHLVTAFLFFSAGEFMSIFRWHLLLQAQSIHIRLLRVIQFGVIGVFFNSALPGVVSGDVVKAIYVGRESGGKRARALGSILFDRVSGLSGLVIVSAVALAVYLSTGNLDPDRFHSFSLLRTAVYTAFIGVLVFFCYLFWVRKESDPLMKRLLRWEERGRGIGSVKRIYEGILEYRDHRSTVVYAIFISLTVHLFVTLGCYQLYHAFDEHILSWGAICVVVPLGLVASAIPVLPMGIGTGHAAFIALFLLMGSQRGADLFNLYLLMRLIFGLIGGAYYLRFKSEHQDISAQELAQSSQT